MKKILLTIGGIILAILVYATVAAIYAIPFVIVALVVKVLFF